MGDDGRPSSEYESLMSPWRFRDFHDEDLDQAISIWEQNRLPGEPAPAFGVSEVVTAARGGQPCVVAVVGDQLVGLAGGVVHGERAWITMVALSSRWRDRGIGSALLGELEQRLRVAGARRITALLPVKATGTTALLNSDYEERTGLSYFEKVDHLGASDAGLLSALGAQVIPRGHWNALAGMETEKRVIERRIVLPLVEPNVAAEYGVSPPKAVILFGPPGTGKTSFAKAIAGRLGWPFVELFPSRLATPEVAMAGALREAFGTLADLDSVLVFIDEVEEVAGSRSGVPTDPAHGVTNELLKLIPSFRQHGDRLLVCATNSVRSLDSAILGRGDSTTSFRSVRRMPRHGRRSGNGISSPPRPHPSRLTSPSWSTRARCSRPPTSNSQRARVPRRRSSGSLHSGVASLPEPRTTSPPSPTPARR